MMYGWSETFSGYERREDGITALVYSHKGTWTVSVSTREKKLFHEEGLSQDEAFLKADEYFDDF